MGGMGVVLRSLKVWWTVTEQGLVIDFQTEVERADDLLDASLTGWPFRFDFNPAYVIFRRRHALAGAQRRYAVQDRVNRDGLVGENGLRLFRGAMALFYGAMAIKGRP